MHVNLAKNAATHYYKYQALMPLPEYLPGNLAYQHACYVSIFENPGMYFRSIYGTPLPYQPCLAQEIIVNTVNAMFADGQRPVRQIDLPNLVYKIAVLGPLERIGGDNHLDPRYFGLYVRSDRNKKAVILTERAGIETGSDQIATALRESDINTREEAYTLYRFKVTRYE